MVSSYDISGGSTSVSLGSFSDTYIAMQLVGNASVNGDVTVKLQHSSDGVNYIDLEDTTNTILSGGSDVYIESFNYTLNELFLNIDVGTATLGTINFFISSKKKAGNTSTTLDDLSLLINEVITETDLSLVTRPTDYRHEVAMGRRNTNVTINKFGYNEDIDIAGGEEIIASFGGALGVNFDIMTTADTLDVVSTSASDGVAGTGALTVLLLGISSTFLSQSETITMNGITPVTTSNTWLGINRAVLLSSGTNNTNVGTIDITDTSGAVGVQAQIPIGSSVTQQMIYHTQIGHNLLIDNMFLNALKISGGGSPRILFKGYSYSRVTDTIYEVFRHNQDTGVENTVVYSSSQPFVIGGREVIFFVASTDTNNSGADMRFSGIEEAL